MEELGKAIGVILFIVTFTLGLGVILGIGAGWALVVYEIAKFTFNLLYNN